MSYIYCNNYYVHWIGLVFLKDIFVVQWYRRYKQQKIDNKIMVASHENSQHDSYDTAN